MKKAQAQNPILIINEDYKIEVEKQNWTVWQQYTISDKAKKNPGAKAWRDIGYCRDLPAALKLIAREMTSESTHISSIRDYLSWYESIIDSMLKSLLRQQRTLQEGLEKNKVMVSYHNFKPQKA